MENFCLPHQAPPVHNSDSNWEKCNQVQQMIPCPKCRDCRETEFLPPADQNYSTTAAYGPMLYGLCGRLVNALKFACRTIGREINWGSRPDWETSPAFQPYSQRSYDIGNYEYEVMVFRSPVANQWYAM